MSFQCCHPKFTTDMKAQMTPLQKEAVTLSLPWKGLAKGLFISNADASLRYQETSMMSC